MEIFRKLIKCVGWNKACRMKNFHTALHFTPSTQLFDRPEYCPGSRVFYDQVKLNAGLNKQSVGSSVCVWCVEYKTKLCCPFNNEQFLQSAVAYMQPLQNTASICCMSMTYMLDLNKLTNTQEDAHKKTQVILIILKC